MLIITTDMPRIILIRHAECETNAQGKSGTFESPLTELGVKQAKFAGKILAANYNITKIVHSPMVRTTQTAKFLATALELKNIEAMDVLTEGDNGLLAGSTPDEVKNIPKIGKKASDIIAKLDTFTKIDFTKGKSADLDNKLMKLAGGESDEQIHARARKAVKAIKAIKTKGDILVVSHNGFIKALLYVMYKISHFGVGSNYGKYKNCHISVINKTTSDLELQMYSEYLDELK